MSSLIASKQAGRRGRWRRDEAGSKGVPTLSAMSSPSLASPSPAPASPTIIRRRVAALAVAMRITEQSGGT
jgi:hypothetical protein